MSTSENNQGMRIGDFVQMRASGLQGMIYKRYKDAWEVSPDSREVVLAFLQQHQPEITEETVPSERAYAVAYLNSGFVFSFESELQEISLDQVKFREYPKAFKEHVVEVFDRRKEEFPR